MPNYDYECSGCGTMELSHSIMDDALTVCPICGKEGLIRLISNLGGVIIGGREVNQYSDCKGAKYWRDKNGDRHKVTASDGHSRAPTVTKQTRTPEEVKAIKKQASKVAKKKRSKDSYKRFRRAVKKKHRI